jgi:hypothetical protein
MLRGWRSMVIGGLLFKSLYKAHSCVIISSDKGYYCDLGATRKWGVPPLFFIMLYRGEVVVWRVIIHEE